MAWRLAQGVIYSIEDQHRIAEIVQYSYGTAKAIRQAKEARIATAAPRLLEALKALRLGARLAATEATEAADALIAELEAP